MNLAILLKFFILRTAFVRSEFLNVTRRITRQLDVSYGSPTYKCCECGRKNDVIIGDIRVVGGSEIAENEYPWMTIIMVKGKLICGGTLINDRYVVTAANCLALGHDQREMKVVVGEFDICEDDTQTVTFSIDNFIVHPRYNEKNEYANIMLVRLNMRVTFNKFVRPICLPEIESRLRTAKKYAGKFVTALGWGETDTKEKICALRSVNLEIFKPEYCRINVATIICAGLNGGTHDTCQGDSGGPLQAINSQDRYQLIGVTSTRNSCSDGFSVLYTDVVAMVPWIMKITTRDSMYCWR